MRYQPIRFAGVPWLLTDTDLRPMGAPETSVEIGQQIAHGLHIPQPFGRGTDAMLTITATAGNGTDGGVITLAIGTELAIDHDPKPPMDMTLLSGGPRQRIDNKDAQQDFPDATDE
jgi:hypothetical protein